MGCSPWPDAENLRIINALLLLGADPMVKAADERYSRGSPSPGFHDCFWRTWAHLVYYVSVNEEERDALWWITKRLLESGADIQYPLFADDISYKGFRVLNIRPWYLQGRTSIMYALQRRFSGYPDFCAYTASAMSNERPLRTVNVIPKRKTGYANSQKLQLDSPEEDHLWELLEDWEENRQEDDVEQILSVVKTIWRERKADIYRENVF